MTSHFLFFMTLAGALFLAGCGSTPEPVEQPAYRKTLVGRIASVRPAAKYVLVQRYGRLEIDPGAFLYALDHDGKFHTLTFSGEILGQFLAFDTPETNILQQGFAVYSSETNLSKLKRL